MTNDENTWPELKATSEETTTKKHRLGMFESSMNRMNVRDW
ncbi:hypothetical protein M513_13662 [Trichuris suis]|uniref:Uncharacterized protein n=1 Tax=Trichuris suis TaxID=68888 RepID=A0A085LKG6_9BILA|nr:hypothetical protein M513_13662 [Trichuris suis]